MLLAFGAAASAIDTLFGLVSSKQTSQAGSGPDQANLFAFQADASTPQSTGTTPGSGGGGAQISPETMSALLAAQGQASSVNVSPTSRHDALKDLFSQIDGDGDGKITKSEFEDALGAGGTNVAQADDVFGKMDKNGDGSVSLDEMSSALKGDHDGHRGRYRLTGNGDSGDPLLQALQGTSGSTVTNSDGSTTTSLTYADGSTVTLTTPSASSAAGTATSSYNFIEQLIQRQANQIASQTASSLSVSV